MIADAFSTAVIAPAGTAPRLAMMPTAPTSVRIGVARSASPPGSACALVAALTLSNCSGPTGPETQRGAVVGGLLGAGAGAIIGNQSGRAGEGALIGAAAGGLGGAAIGNARDTERSRYQQGNQGGYYDKYGNYHRNGY